MYTTKNLQDEIVKRISANSVRKVKFSDCTMIQKIETLSNLCGKTIEEDATYKVTDTIKRDDYKSENDFLTAIAKVSTFADAMKVSANKENAFNYTTEKKGKNLSQKQQISVLSNFCKDADIKVDTTEFEVEILGGENFVAMLNYVRGLSEDDFNALIKK
jgi:hypothetical protein